MLLAFIGATPSSPDDTGRVFAELENLRRKGLGAGDAAFMVEPLPASADGV
jgi:hypothetical protein